MKTRVSTNVSAPPSKVWQALTDPEIVKQYLFGTQVVTDWKEGRPIRWKGVWQGKPYEDKGIVLKVVPEKLLETTYWSGNEGLPDEPEYYKTVTYELAPEGTGTRITLTQDNNRSAEERDHSTQNWKMVLDALKKVLE